MNFLDSETQNQIKTELHKREVEVVFTKKDGTERAMKCTLNESTIPSDKLPKNKETKFSDDALRVFDTQIAEWRSFRWDSIKTVNL
jgi:hypothetical protein